MSNEPVARPGTLIHIGSPSAAQIADDRVQAPARLVFVVPSPEGAARLERDLAQETGVQVLHAAVAAS